MRPVYSVTLGIREDEDSEFLDESISYHINHYPSGISEVFYCKTEDCTQSTREVLRRKWDEDFEDEARTIIEEKVKFWEARGWEVIS